MRFSKKCILGVLVFGAFALLFWRVSVHGNSENLLVFKNSITEQAGALVLLNLGTKEEISPTSTVVGCSALPIIRGEQDIDIYCIGQEALESHWVLDMENKTVARNGAFIANGAEITVPAHPRIVQGVDGWRYYNAGGPVLFGENGNETTARVVAVRGSEIHAIPISDRMKPYKILRMVLDSESKKLWVMSVGAQSSVLIDRIDTDTRAVDFSLTLNAYLGFDLLIDDKFTLISTFRTEAGTDLTVLDKNSGEVIKEISLPVIDEKLNALSMIRYEDGVLVSSLGGLFLLESSSFEIVDFIPNNPGGQFVNLVESEAGIFAVSNYDRVVKMEKNNLMKTTVVYEASGEGITSVSYVVNNAPWYVKLKDLYYQ